MEGKTLHITNGEAVRVPVYGRVVYWNDVLHEGPVPAGLSLEELSRERARFFAQCGWGDCGDVGRDFQERDAALASCRCYGEVVLWFEHDLYDQLQLAQILDWFSREPLDHTRLSLICICQFPGLEMFHGLGQLTGAQLALLWTARRPVAAAQLELGRRTWEAFRSPDPAAVEHLLAGDTSALPFLDDALLRHLQQFPSTGNGLSRSEQQILDLVSAGVTKPRELFVADQKREERVFLGDATFFWYLERLCRGSAPLLRMSNGDYKLTAAGRDVLESRQDAVALNGIDRWLGGVHLTGREAAWRWDEVSRRIVGTEPSRLAG